VKKVLIVDGYARQTLPITYGFCQIHCEVTIVCYSKSDVGYQTKYANHILLKCGKENYSEQEKLVCELIKSGDYDLVVPMTDYSAIYLAKNKAFLSKYAYLAINDPEVFNLAIDKTETMKLCLENHIPAPVTLITNEPTNELKEKNIQYPLVIKPKTACGSIGFSIINNEEHLTRILSSYDGSNGEIFIQEYIPQKGPQYGAEVYRNRDGSFAFTLIDEKPRWFPLDGGSPTINISVHNNEMKIISEKLLSAMNWHGYANIDFVFDCRDEIPKVLEINGRISAAVKLDFCCGINVAEIIYEDAFGTPKHCNDYKDGIKTSCFLTELLWFIKSPERFKQKPIFLNRKNTKDVIFSWGDLKPTIGFCLQSIRNYRHAMKKRERK